MKPADSFHDTCLSLERLHQQTFERMEVLLKTLTSLHFEPGASFGKNVEKIRTVLSFFEDDLLPHIRYDEKIIFPFAETHIPRLGSVLNLLRAEHKEFLESLENFKSIFEQFSKSDDDSNRSALLERLREIGFYLFYLMRTHIRAEEEGVYRVMNKELKGGEKSTLNKILNAQLSGS